MDSGFRRNDETLDYRFRGNDEWGGKVLNTIPTQPSLEGAD
jgi:hypothetical protein